MKILCLASGSGGHVYPCLSVMEKLLDSHEVIYIIIKDSFESKITLNPKIKTYLLDVKIQGSYYKKNPLKIVQMIKKVKKISQKIGFCDAILCFGGFISVIGIFLKFFLKAPLYLHEQNSILGDSNKFALKYAKKIFISYKETPIPKHYLSKVIFIGNPRSDNAKKYLINQKIESFNILFLAGSLGSSSLLNIIRDTVNSVTDNDLHFTIITGQKLYKEFQGISKENVIVKEYDNNILKTMSEAAIIIMRAGASSLSEVISLNIPSIIIPSPYVKHNHQEENALYFLKKGAIIMLKEEDLTSDNLLENILKLKNDRYFYYMLKENMSQLVPNNVIDKLIYEITK